MGAHAPHAGEAVGRSAAGADGGEPSPALHRRLICARLARAMNYRDHSKSTRERIVAREVRKLELRRAAAAEVEAPGLEQAYRPRRRAPRREN